MDPALAAAMAEQDLTHFANPASSHPLGRMAAKLLESSRERIAATIGASPDEICFTSGGTESLLLAIHGSAGETPGQIVVSAVEHAAVFEAAKALTSRGFTITKVPVDSQGFTTPEALASVLDRKTKIVAIMAAQNEVGSINDIKALSAVVRKLSPRAKFVVDAVQALGKVHLNVQDLDVDCLAMTAHKLHGPKGIGALYSAHQLKPVMKGGGQERGQRGGTQAATLAFGFAEALAAEPSGVVKMAALRDRLWTGIKNTVPSTQLIGPPIDSPSRLCNHLMILVPGSKSEPMLNSLSARGLCASAGSACTTGAFSHVLTELGHVSEEGAFIRLTLGRQNTEEEVDQAITIFAEATKEIHHFYS